jgi:hypothetical protein
MNERKGVPRLSQITWFWAVVFTLFSSGAFALVLAIYLSAWIRIKRKAGIAIYIYSILAVSLPFDLIPDRFLPHGVALDYLSTVLSVAFGLLWILGAFLLRRELMLYYASREGGVLEMSPLWTALFTVYYLNYCLWVVRDSA